MTPAAVVVDASLGLKWVLSESMAIEARTLLAEWERDRVARIVPALFMFEAANVLYRRARAGEFSLGDAHDLLDGVLAGVEIQQPVTSAVRRAMEIAHDLGRAAAYDAQYAALAEREGCELWTADERLRNASHARYPFVRWLGER